MDIETLAIPDIKIITPKIFDDARGFFFESFNQQRFEEMVGQSVHFVQDYHCQLQQWVRRNLHYQTAPFVQAKLVRVIAGSIYNVALDNRRESPSYGRFVSMVLSADNKKQIWIPEGFAHGFMALENNSEICYKTTNFYSPEHDKSILFDEKYIDDYAI